MNVKNLVIIFIAILLGSCEKEDSEVAFDNWYQPGFSSSQTEFTSQEIWNAAYSNYRYPSGFNVENIDGTSLFYENTQSINDATQTESVYEVCTDNKEKAIEWATKSTSTQYIDFIVEETIETDKYFQIKKVNKNSGADIILSRVHKCSYFSRLAFDNSNSQIQQIGIFNDRPFNLEKIKSFAEYLWFIDNSENKKVLSTFTNEESSMYIHYIFELTIVIASEGKYDTLIVDEVKYKIDNQSGVVERERTEVYRIDGKLR